MAEENTQTETPPKDDAALDAASPEGTDTSQSDEDGFDTAFSERASGQEGEAEIETQTDGGEPSKEDEPAPARSDAPPAAAADEKPDNGNAEAFDPWNGMTPEQVAHFKEIEQSERSQRGRVSALTKKLNGNPAPKAATPAPQDAKEAGQPAASEEQPQGEGEEASVSNLDTRLQAAVDEYGDVIGPVADILKDVRAEIADLQKTATKVEIDADAAETAEALGALEKVHPDYRTVAADESFKAWLSDQPQGVIALANSFDPKEVSLSLTLFKTERAAAKPVDPVPAGEGEPQANSTNKRAKQLEGNKQVTSRNAPAASGVPDDFGAAFEQRGKAHAKQ